MREIKFRAWTKKNEMQYNVVPFQWDYVIDRMWHRCIESNGSGILGSDGTEAKFEVGGLAIEEGNIMQFTGLKDKKEQDLWEGDIVIASLSGIVNEDIKSIIDFENGCFGIRAIENGILVDSTGKFKSFDGCNTQKQIEIIGNKFENPELLKQ